MTLAPHLPPTSWPNARPAPERRFRVDWPARVDIAKLKGENPLDDAMTKKGVALGRVNARGIREATCLCAPKPGKRPLWVNTQTNSWGCLAQGSVCGGDIFTFLDQVEGLTFQQALDALGGATHEYDPQVAARLETERQARAAALAAAAAAHDEAERAKAFAIWQAAGPTANTQADAYWRHRGLVPFASKALRFSPDEPYFHMPPEPATRPIVVHRGPCIVSAIQDAAGRFFGIHRTWLDPRLDASLGHRPLPRNPDGKPAKGTAVILAPDGSALNAKKYSAGKQGGAIRLADDDGRATGARGFLCGEGIETTATVYQGLVSRPKVAGRPDVSWYAWAAGDLGNLAGGALGPSIPHPDKPGRRVPDPTPDPARPGLMPPRWADRAILLGDGDSDALVTQARLACAKARWEAAGIPTTIVMAPEGADFNDLVRG